MGTRLGEFAAAAQGSAQTTGAEKAYKTVVGEAKDSALSTAAIV
jgi:hypothetical protein